MEHDEAHQRRRLYEAGLSETDARELDQQLKQAGLPHSRPEHRAQVLLMLDAQSPEQKSSWERFWSAYPIVLLQSQVRVIQSEIWLGTALVLLVGLVHTLLSPLTMTFAVLAPLVSAVGIGLLYDQDAELMLELESSTRANGSLLLLARLTLVFGFNLGLALIGSIILAIVRLELSLFELIGIWLAPMAFLSGLAFFLAVWSRQTTLGASVSLLLWLVHLLFKGNTSDVLYLQILTFAGLSAPDYRGLLIACAGLLVAVALWLLHQQEWGAFQQDAS